MYVLHYRNRLHGLKPFVFVQRESLCREVPCTVTKDPPFQSTFSHISVKVEPTPVAIEMAVFKDRVLESGGVRSNCAVFVGPRFDTRDWDSHANMFLSSTYRKGVKTDEIGTCQRDVFIDLTKNYCPSTAGPLISSPGSEVIGVTWMVQRVRFRPQTIVPVISELEN